MSKKSIMTMEKDSLHTRCGIIEPLDEGNDGALPGSTTSHNRDHLASRYGEREVVEDLGVAPRWITEDDITKLNLPLDLLELHTILLVTRDQWLTPDHLKHSVSRDTSTTNGRHVWRSLPKGPISSSISMSKIQSLQISIV